MRLVCNVADKQMKTRTPLTRKQYQRKIEQIKHDIRQKEKEKERYELELVNSEYRTMQIATEVYSLMRKKQFSIKEVAEQVSFPYKALYRVLNRERLLAPEEEERLAEWLKKNQ